MALSKIDVANMLTGLVPNDNTIRRKNAKPLIINGDMSVSQRGTSFSPSGAGGNYMIDRYSYDVTGSGTGDATITQESDAPASTNLRKSLKITPDATETLSSGENIVFTTSLEGQDVQVLGHGTSSPPKATLSFWVKSSKTGTYCVQIKEETISDESYLLFEYSISSANTWEQKILTWTGNTAHTLNSDNTMGFRIVWHLAVHSDDHASATTTWTESTSFKATSNQVNFFDSTSNNWYLTGVQLEVGEYTSSTLPPFQHESYGDNLKRCERYYQVVGSGTRADNLTYFPAYNHDSTSTMFGLFNFRTTMRTEPSIDQESGSNYYTFKCNNATDDFDGVNGFRGGIHAGEFYLSGGSSVGSSSAGQAGKVMGKNSSSHVALSAEL